MGCNALLAEALHCFLTCGGCIFLHGTHEQTQNYNAGVRKLQECLQELQQAKSSLAPQICIGRGRPAFSIAQLHKFMKLMLGIYLNKFKLIDGQTAD
ncbi:unnamed protein product [Durusdinium trenchii]|uniref:Uncharacterized protein n=1 Tax=Durusdinium trenchii TaxID=1381693 RepID=A0ABP0HQT8_9DINO